MSIQFRSIWPIYRTLSGATTSSQNRLGNDGNKWILRIPQRHSITVASPSDCLVSYPGHSLGESYSSVKMQSVYSIQSQPTRPSLGESYPSTKMHSAYSTATADSALVRGVCTTLQRYSRCILNLQPTRPSLGESNHSAGMQSVYSTATADWVLVLTHKWDPQGYYHSGSEWI